MQTLLIPFFCLLAAGLYFILAHYLKIPTLKTTKAVLTVTRRDKRNAKSFEAIVFDLASRLAKCIKIGDYQKRKMTALLRSANIEISPETYIAKAVLIPSKNEVKT